MGLKGKIILVAIGFLFATFFGVPLITSYPSYLWHMTKFNIQGLNCLSDTNKAVTKIDTLNSSKQIGDDYEKIGTDLEKCRKGWISTKVASVLSKMNSKDSKLQTRRCV